MPAAVLIPIAISAAGTAAQLLLAPRIKQPKTDKGKLDDVRATSSDYGAFIPRTWGRTRQGGNIVVSTGIDHYTIETPGTGGKKGGTAPETEHIYKTSIAMLVNRNPLGAFLRVWANFDLLLNNSPGVSGRIEAEDPTYITLSGGATIYADGTASESSAVTGLGLGGTALIDASFLPDPTQNDGDPGTNQTRISFYYKCAANRTATVSVVDENAVTTVYTVSFPASTTWTVASLIVTGFADSITFANAGAAAPDLDYLVIQKYRRFHLPDRNHTYQISGVVNPDIAYPVDLNDPSEYYNYSPELLKDGTTGTYSLHTAIPAQVVRFYTGSELQTADPKIVSWLDSRYGAGQGQYYASAMRGLSYIFIENYTMKESRLANFTVETDTEDYYTNTILADLFADVNLQSSDYNITATSALTQIGFLEHTQRSRKALIEDLSRYHFFRLGEIDGKIKTIAESFTVVGTIDIDNLRAHNSEEEMPGYDVDVTIKEDHLLPKEVKVSVMDPALEYHNETAASQLFTGISGTESVEYTFSIVDPASEARNRAERLLLKAYSENIEYEFFAMPSEAKYSIGDIIQAPVNGINYRMRIESKQMTLPIGAIKFRCVSISPFTPTVYQDNVTSLATRAGDQFARDSFPRNSIVLPIWSEPIREADKGRLGVYLAVSGRGRGFGSSASLYREIADEYFELQKAGIPFSPMGISASTLPSHVVGEDGTNQLDVWFFDDVSLESVTSGDITRYPLVNLLRIGNEWIRFRDAAALTLEDNSPYGSKWRLTNLYRGQFGTESAAGTSKAAGEYAALVTPSLQFYELEQEDIGQFVTLKAVTVGQDIDVAPETSFVFAGANTTPSLSLADLPVMTSAQFATKISDETGTAGKLVFSTSPVLVAPILGTPNSGNLINCTGFPAAALSGMASWMPSFLTTPLVTDVRGRTFSAAGAVQPSATSPRYFYASATGSFDIHSAGLDTYMNNLNPANAGVYGVKGEVRQGVDRSGGNGVIYGGYFIAGVAGNVETAYGFNAKLTVDTGKTANEAGAVIFGTSINGSITTFSALKQELLNSGTCSNFYGTYTRIQNNSAGVLTSVAGSRVSITQNGSSAITTFKGVAFEGYSGSGSITNNYLLYADTSTASYGSTNKYGIYFLPDMPSHHVGKFGIGSGATAPSARLQVRDTTEPLRLEYDVNNYMKAVVGSTGMVTFDAVGSGTTGFTFSDAVTFPGAARFRGYTSSTNPPSTTELPNDKDFSIHEETDVPNFWLAFNRGGTIYKVALV